MEQVAYVRKGAEIKVWGFKAAKSTKYCAGFIASDARVAPMMYKYPPDFKEEAFTLRNTEEEAQEDLNKWAERLKLPKKEAAKKKRAARRVTTSE